MNEKKAYLTVKDHSVSGETFDLIKNSEYGFLETIPQPSLEKLPNYYKSEDYISHTDSKRNLFENVYHLIRGISLKQKMRLINSCTSSEKKLLDVGCGTGDFLQVAKKDTWEVYGIEPNEHARAIANKKTDHSVFDVDQLLKFKPNSFDVITLWHVLEHLPNLEEQIQVFKNLLKLDGTLIIAVPNFNSYDAKFYKSHWAAFDAPRHLWHFSKSSMSKLVSNKNMKVVKSYPMLFDAFYVSLLSEKYRTGHMNLFRAFFIGFISNMKALSSKEFSSIIYMVKNDNN
tara:strand:+ start:2526 stop:3383 length:858 start_codon:yes stop_codon:yes gene_type:complete